MIYIANPSARLEAFCGSAVTTDVKFSVSYFNLPQQSTSDVPKQLGTLIRTVSNGVTDVQIAPYPGQNSISSTITTGTGAVQVIQYVKAHNTNASSVTVTIQINDGTDDIQWKGTIPAGGTAYCDNEGRWYVLDGTGALVTTIGVFPTRPMVVAYNSADDTNQTGNGAVATISYDTELLDSQGNFSGTTFTAPATGTYLVMLRVRVSAIPAGCTSCFLQVIRTGQTFNGNQESFVAGTWTIRSLTLNTLVPMTAGNTITTTVSFSGGAGDTATIEGDANLSTSISISQVG